MLLRSSQNTTILRVASGAIANLAMNGTLKSLLYFTQFILEHYTKDLKLFLFVEMNQGLIMSKGGARLLANTASKTDDPQTLRMVAGAVANLCGNGKLKMILQLLCQTQFHL